MPSIKINITSEFFNERLSQNSDQKWRSLEHFLERYSRRFIFNDSNRSVTVAVADELDAQRLMQDIGLISVNYINENGEEKLIEGAELKRPFLREATVYVKREDKKMSFNEYKKYIKSGTISKSAVVKRGILTKSEIERAILLGKLLTVKVGKSVRISQESLRDYL